MSAKKKTSKRTREKEKKVERKSSFFSLSIPSLSLTHERALLNIECAMFSVFLFEYF